MNLRSIIEKVGTCDIYVTIKWSCRINILPEKKEIYFFRKMSDFILKFSITNLLFYVKCAIIFIITVKFLKICQHGNAIVK